jgi:HEAT repeat protein
MKPASPVVIQKHANHSSARSAQNWHPVCDRHLLRLCAHAFLGLLLFVLPSYPQTSAPGNTPAVAPSDAEPATSPEPEVRDQHTPPGRPHPWQILTSGATDHNSLRRAEAIAALGTMAPSPGVLHLVENALDDKDSSIRQLAAMNLGQMRARHSIPRLKKALNDPSPEVSFAAAKSLWNMGDHSGRDVFIRILSGEKSSSSSGVIKDEVEATKRKFDDKRKLAIIGATEAASSLFGPAGWGIKIMEEVTRDRSASARAMSAILLSHDTSLDGLRELQDALSDKNWIVRAAAAQALGASRHRDQIQYLRPLLDDDKPAVRFMAAASILRLSSAGKGAAAEPANPLKSEARPALGPHGPNTSQ